MNLISISWNLPKQRLITIHSQDLSIQNLLCRLGLEDVVRFSQIWEVIIDLGVVGE